MDLIRKLYVRFQNSKGQSMAEYALIMGAIAVAVYASYTTLGGAINTTVANVTKNL